MFNAKTSATLSLLFLCFFLSAQKKTDTIARSAPVDSLKNISFAGLKFRSIGPAITGGRVIDIAVNPKNTSEYFVASGHGSLWKTTNNGVTFNPAFEGQSSFAMGAVRIDPSNTNIDQPQNRNSQWDHDNR